MVQQNESNMKIGIIGAGPIGFNLARLLAPNHEIKLAASKVSEELLAKATSAGAVAVDIKDVVKNVEVIIFSIPLKAITELPKDLFDDISDNVIIADTSNYYPFRDGNIEELDNGKPESIWVSEVLSRPVIKAFNNLLSQTLVEEGRPEGAPERLAISVAGNSDDAKLVISGLINEIGFDVVDTGDLAESWRQQPGSPAYCTELNRSELKDALMLAIKEKVPVDRDILIASFQKENFNLSKQEIVETNRSLHDLKLKPRGN